MDVGPATHMVAWSPDGSKLVSSSADGVARLWNPMLSSPIYRMSVASLSQGAALRRSSADFSPDGSQVITAFGGSADIWNVGTGNKVREFRPDNQAAASARFDPQGQRIVIVSGGSASILAANTGSVEATMRGVPVGNTACAWSPDGERLAIAMGNGEAQILNVQKMSVSRNLMGKQSTWSEIAWAQPQNSFWVFSAISGRVEFFGPNVDWPIRSIDYPGARAAAFGNKGRYLLGFADGTVLVIHSQTGIEEAKAQFHKSRVGHLSFCPDEKKVLMGYIGQLAEIVDLETLKSVRELSGHSDGILSTA
jgi:hypothetical protein